MSALIQGSDAWHALRRTKIGASDAGIILGVNPWMTPFKLWQQKQGLIPPEPMNKRKARGLDLESVARELFCLKIGLDMKPDVLFSHKYEWQMASLDGIDVTKSHIVEIKCAGEKDHATALDGKVPEKYYPQLQQQLAVVGLNMAYYFSFDGIDGHILEVQRNDEYIEMMIEKELEFYQCMIDIIPPPLTEKDFSCREDNDWLSLAEEWKYVSNHMKALEEKQKKIKNDLICLAGQSNAKGGGLSLSKTYRKGSVDYAEIPALKGIDLEPYRKPTIEVWTIKSSQ